MHQEMPNYAAIDSTAAKQKTSTKTDADFVLSRFREVYSNLTDITATLERQANKLFGYKPENPCSNDIARESDNVLELLKAIEAQIELLENEASRF